MKKYLLIFGAVIILAVAGRGYWAYQQVKVEKGNTTTQVNTSEDSNSVSATDVSTVEIEEISTGGNNFGPACQYETNPEVEPCRHVEVTYKTELSDNIKNSTYIVGVESNSDQNGWHNSYFVSQPILGVRFLGVGQSLITREAYNKIFLSNTINKSNFVYNFSVRCSDDKNVLPTINSRQCMSSDQQENQYLFNDKGERVTTFANFRNNLINEDYGYSEEIGELETIKKLKNTTSLIIDQGHVYIPVSNPLQKVEVIYSGFIDGNKLMPKDKIEEVSYFKDGSLTTIK